MRSPHVGRDVLIGVVVLALVAAALTLWRVSGTGPTEVPAAGSGLSASIDQARLERVRGTMHVRVRSETGRPVVVTAATLTNDRFGTARWSGEQRFTVETDLTLPLPTGRCGDDGRTTVRLTYREGGEDRVTTLPAPDRYSAIGFSLDRDCAAATMREATHIRVGVPTVEGEGRRSVLSLPVTLTPTGRRDDVRFAGFESTTLLDVLPPERSRAPRAPLVGDAQSYPLRLTTSRCDAHALAEDKVGTLIGVRVQARGLPEDADFYLPIPASTRAAMHQYYAQHCSF